MSSYLEYNLFLDIYKFIINLGTVNKVSLDAAER
jgi:hypothetical protein